MAARPPRAYAGGGCSLNKQTRETAQLLHVLGYLYGSHGQLRRGAAYLLTAVQLAPDDVGILRTLAHLLVQDGEADKALATIARLETLDQTDHFALKLLKSRALLAAGRKKEARETMKAFLARREEA
jgi:type III secretion protein Y